MMERLRKSAVAPWAGIFMGAAAWATHHQLGSDLNYYDCRNTNPPMMALLGLFFLLVALTGAFISWSAREDSPDAQGRAETRRFASLAGMGSASLFSLAILFQTLASVLVPACHR